MQELWNHQKKAVETAKNLPWYALFMGVGTGKTRAVIETLRAKFNTDKKIYRTIIFGPPIIVQNWKDEWYKYSKIESGMVIPLVGPGPKRLDTFLNNCKDKDGKRASRIFITNYETLLMPHLYNAFVDWRPECLVLDEAHKVKNHESKRAKFLDDLANPWNRKLKKYAEHAPIYKTILTGTPILKDPMDLFMQFKILMGGFPNLNFLVTRNHDDLIKNFYHFRARYFEDKNARWKGDANYFPDWHLKGTSLDEINQILKLYSIHVVKEECLDLPDELSVITKVDMTTPQKKNYLEMKNELVAYSKDGTASADLALTKALRLMQITSGFLPVRDETRPDSDEVLLHYEKNPKDEALEELLESITPTSKVLVWAVWRFNYAAIRGACEKLGLKYVEIHGGVSAKQKDTNIEAFKQDPSIRVLIGHPGSGGIGVTLTCAPYSIFYSRTFSLEHYVQARARNHRGGQMDKVTHYDLVCRDTIDELVLEKLAGKMDVSGKILELAKEL